MKLKSKSKKDQEELIKRIEDSLSAPSKLVPDCIDGGFLCPFSSYKKKLAGIADLKDFKKFSRSSDNFLSGLAESEEVVESKSVPMTGIISTAYGSIEYAKRGDTDPNVLAGIQNSASPLWRMLSFYSLVYNKGVRIYSSTNYYLASCKGTSPGIDFFRDCLNDEKIGFTEKESTLVVGSGDAYFDLYHIGLLVLRIYDSSTDNTINRLLRHILVKDAFADFRIVFSFSDSLKVSNERFMSEYFAGKISDRELIKRARDLHYENALKHGSYVIGDRVFSSAEEFISAFGNQNLDLMKLQDVIIKKGSIRLNNASVPKLMEILWPEFSEEIMRALFPGITDWNRKGSPMAQIDGVMHRLQSESTKSKIVVDSWSKPSAILAELISDYKTEGQEYAVKIAIDSVGQSATAAAVVYAFLQEVGGLKGREWMFDRVSIDLGEKIRPTVRLLLNAEGEDFRFHFEELRKYI
ncbi:MAG: hypothetical protein M1454_02400 [Candidatus Thermoplasmatota archaeon]|nr:hypothetical protein [Candidatus Thermoplasmatota archaeon]MCL5731447.1 hypothetical protein [Candidatus Thermoplasmatota archaeon]